MLAFAANSLLICLAFVNTSIDEVSFTVIRILTGAITLLTILIVQGEKVEKLTIIDGISTLLLFTYAVSFSFAYRSIDAGVGALILFATAQLMMILCGLLRGERTNFFGICVALLGFILFLMPTASFPPIVASLLMIVSGLAWGGFSLLGKSSHSPVVSTASCFLLSIPLSLLLLLFFHENLQFDLNGIFYATLSGSLASGIGYALWYWIRVRMTTINAGAGIVQLSVPILSAILGLLILEEEITLRSAIAAVIVLIGVSIVTLTTKMVDNIDPVNNSVYLPFIKCDRLGGHRTQ